MTHGRRGGLPREAVTGASRPEQLGGLRHLHRVSPRPRASGLANCYLHPGIVTSRSGSSCVRLRRARGWFAGRGESVFIPRSVLPAHIHSPADHPALCNVSASGILPQAESQGSLEPKALSVFCKNLNPFYKTLNPGGEWESGREAEGPGAWRRDREGWPRHVLREAEPRAWGCFLGQDPWEQLPAWGRAGPPGGCQGGPSCSLVTSEA